MRKYLLKFFGLLFLAGGLWILFGTFLNPKSGFFLSLKLAGTDIGSIAYGILSLAAGYYILRLNPAGRILGIVVLCPYLIVFAYLAIVMPVLIFSGESRALPYIRFRATEYGMSADFSITNPVTAALIYFFVAFIIGLWMWFFMSSNTRVLFSGNNKMEPG